MASTKETIDEVLKKHDELSEEQKQSLRSVLTDVFEKGKSPAEAMQIDEDLLEAAYALAYHNYRIGQVDDASAIFEMLFTLKPSDERILLGSAACFHQMKEYDKAIERYMMIPSFDADTPLPYFYCIDCWLEQDKLMEALIFCSITINKAEQNPALYEQIIDRARLIADKLTKELELPSDILEQQSALEQLESISAEELAESLKDTGEEE